MTRMGRLIALALASAFVVGSPLAAQEPADGAGEAATESLDEWLDAIDSGLERGESAVTDGRAEEANRLVLRVYLDYFERIEGYYGAGGEYGTPALADVIGETERRFHVVLSDAEDLEALRALQAGVDQVRATAHEAGVRLRPAPVAPVAAATGPALDRAAAKTPEVAGIMEEITAAREAFRAGDLETSLARVEHAYLEGFEPIEPRLPSANVNRVEKLIHLTLRPQLSQGAPAEEVEQTFDALESELLALDAALDEDTPFWFGAFNAFMIILREGLEAVLLIGALLAYLGASGASRRHHRQIYAGVAAGVAASFATWIAARTLIPIGGASRELLEGITALIAVGVLLYVSHWLFQKSYIHDWKAYLQENVNRAISGGSALAMAGLAFAAVYREGFETVLFYQALLFDTGAPALLTGFIPGLILITGVGVGIIRLGLRLPLRQVFTATNVVLLYLAFVFLGKGIYNLQEGGLFAPHHLSWLPDHPALRQMLGFYPLLEPIAAQGGFLVLLAATYLYYRRRIRRRDEATDEPERATAAT